MMVKFFQHKFGVNAKFSKVRKFNQQQLERMLLVKGLKKKNILAAKKIQAIFRGKLARRRFKQMLIDREQA